jgi:WD40 repeat protein
VDVLGTVRLLDVSTGTWLKHRWSSQHGSTSESSFSPDGRTLAIVKGLNIQLFDVATERELVRVSSRSWGSHGSTEPLYEFRFAFSTDSRLFAVGTAAGDPVRLFEAATGTELTRMDLGWGFAGVLFSPDGRSLAAASNNGSVRLLDVDSRRLPGTSQHAKAVTHLEFSPDSRFLVTSGKDGAALMTETPTGREIARFEHGEPITEAHFSPDGQSLLTVGGEKVKIWPGDPEWPFQQLCARAGRNLTSEEWRTFIGESEPWRPTCPNWHQVAVSEPTRQ